MSDVVQYDSITDAARKKLFQAASYLNETELALVERACQYAFIKHDGQTRQSGEPYITHPIAVATEVAKWHLDVQTIVASLLHDVLEDTDVSKQELAIEFNETIADIVDGLSKLEKINYQNYVDHQAESFRKMILAMVKDLRILIVKLSDRLHNMRTLGSMRPEKRRRIATETIETYAQLANRIGMNNVYRQLQDLSFSHLYPLRYKTFQAALNKWRNSRQEVISEVLREFSAQLVAFNIEAKIKGHEKNLYSIFKKMQEKKLRFSEVSDIYGFRVIVHSMIDCYRTLGALHQLYKPKPGRFKDFIAIPKSNGYQGIHTTLVGPKGLPIEVQIHTQRMNEIAEVGAASHWIHRDNQPQNQNQEPVNFLTHQWLQKILDLQSNSDNAIEFSEHVKVDLYSNEVYTFTPNGKIIVLPKNATPIDFAYAIHTDIGHRCIGAKVNNELVSLRHKLVTGNTVEIITQKEEHPNPSWLQFAVSARARSAIRNHIRNLDREEAIVLGEKILQKVLIDILPTDLMLSEEIKDRYLLDLQQQNSSFEDMLYDVGMGRVLPISIALRISELAGKHLGDTVKLSPIKIAGDETGNFHFATCCHPIPGDAIRIALVSNQGLIIHRDTCQNLVKIPMENILEANWEDISNSKPFSVVLRIELHDEKGLLAKIASSIASNNTNIESLETSKLDDDFVEFILTVQVQNIEQLQNVINDLKSIQSVHKIDRI